MDAAALAALLSSSTEQLVGLHAQIGHPPEALQGALDALHQALKTAVDDQIGKVQQEAQSLSTECSQLEINNAQIKTALGEKSSGSPPSLQNAVGQRMMSAAGSPRPALQSDNSMPLLQRRAQLQQEQDRLRTTYTTREAQIDRLSAKLQTYITLLGNFVSNLDSNNPVGPFRDVSLSKVAAIEAEIIRCSKEVNARSELLQNNLLEVVQLWSELCLEPCRPAVAGEDQIFAAQQKGDQVSCGGSTLAFDRAVLAHLQLQPVYDHQKRFTGEFVAVESQSGSDDRATRAVDILADTPTRASLGGLPARHGDDLALPLPSTSKTNTHTLEPSETNLAQAAEKLQWLDTEKRRREMLIQGLYDELSELWAKFDVPEDEMDAFVMENRGSTLEVVEAYQAELEKMKQLKAQHMSLFISKTRERIATLWDSLFLTEEERQISFPSFYIDVLAGSEYDEPLPTDEILASHEQMIDHLTEQVRTKAPVLKVIGRYKELLDEARQLDESAADGSRLLGRSNRGDPGRLLREEKMRKRVKIQKPKIEAELMKVIPAWEEDHNEPFTINGVRYLDELLEQIEGSKENGSRKRTRTASGAQPPPTPMSVPGSARRGPLGASSASNRGASINTPMRPMTPSEGTVKRPRLAPPSTISTAKTPANRAIPASNSTVSRTASARAPVSGAGTRAGLTGARAAYGAGTASVQRPSTSMAGRYRTESSSSQAAPSSSPSRTAGTTAPRAYTAQTPAASTFGFNRNAPATKTIKTQRESFRPRPSLVARVSRSNTVVGGTSRAMPSEIAPGRASKWGEMGPPTWPAADSQASRNVSGSSIHTDVTTVVHAMPQSAPEPAKRSRRAPSMSLEACLANLASSSHGKARLGDAGREDGIYSIRPVSENVDGGDGYARVHGWKDGLRIAGVEETDEDCAAALPRSGSNNWELVAQSDPDHYSHHSSALAA